MRVLASPTRSASPAERVLLRISNSIENGKLPIGSRLPSERDLALSMKVSRVVIREAAKKLEQRGLVRIDQGVGVTVVNNPSWPVQQTLNHLMPESKDRLRHCAQARMLVEPELAASAARQATADAVRHLTEIHQRMFSETDILKASLADIAFHDQIALMAGNKVLSLMMTSITELGRLSRIHTLSECGTQRAQEQHAKILSAITARSEQGARRAMKSHLVAALGDLD